MTVPTTTTYSATAKTAIMSTLLAEIEGGAGSSRSSSHVNYRSSAGALLAVVDLGDNGAVIPEFAKLGLFPASDRVIVSASGTLAYVEICDSDGAVVVSMPAAQGLVAADHFGVANSTQFLAGATLATRSIILG